MTLSLHATTAPAQSAPLPNPTTADVQQTESAEAGGLFGDMLSMLGQANTLDAAPAEDDQANEKPAKDAVDANADNALPGMSQSILSMMLTMPAALGAPVQVTQQAAQAVPDTQPESAASDMPLMALAGNGFAPGELAEKVSVEAGKPNAGKDPMSADALEATSAEVGKSDAGKNSVPREAAERMRIEAGKLDAGQDPASSEKTVKVRVDAGRPDAVPEPLSGEAAKKVRVAADKSDKSDKSDAKKDPASRTTAEKTYDQANTLLDTVLRSTSDRPAAPRTTSGNAVIQETNAMPRAERADLAAADQGSRPALTVQTPTTAFAGDVQEVKQQTVLASAAPGATVAAQAAAHAADVTPSASPAPVVKLAAEPAQAGQQLLHALGDRIQFQVERRSENATIRLDPPMMGRIEITVRHEAGSLQVQLSATNTEVVRQLQAIGDNLRQDLVQRHYADVSVSVFDQARDGRQQQHQQEQGERERRHVGRALADAGQEDAAFTLASE